MGGDHTPGCLGLWSVRRTLATCIVFCNLGREPVWRSELVLGKDTEVVGSVSMHWRSHCERGVRCHR